MKFGLDVATAGDYADARLLAGLAAEAEQAGWDGFFIWDVLFASETQEAPVVDPWIALAAIALQTERIRIGALLTPLARRRPWQIARQAATLDRLAKGRLIFGAALGYQALDFEPFGELFDARIRAEKLDEGLQIVSGLWSGEPFTFHGRHYRLDDVTLRPRPVQSPRIPIWTAGGWPARRPFRRAARWDGVYVMTVNQETNQLLTAGEVANIASYVRARRPSGEPFDIAVNVDLPADARQAAAAVRPFAAAGATWTVLLCPDSPDDYRTVIRRGPPKL